VSQLERLEQLEHEAELLKKMALYYTIRLRKHPVQFHWIKNLSFEELANDATDDSPIDMDAWLDNFNTWKKK
jgi:hypothetical protein